MGGNSSIHVYNNSRYTAYTECNTSAERGHISRGSHITFGIGEGNHNRVVTVKVHDSKNRLIKYCQFSSGHDDSWIIRNDGIKKQRHGEALHIEDPHGAFYGWQTDNEDHYNREDERERAAQIAAEAKRQAQIAENRRKEAERKQQLATEARAKAEAAEKQRKQVAAELAVKQQKEAQRQQQLAKDARSKAEAAEKQRQEAQKAKQEQEQKIAQDIRKRREEAEKAESERQAQIVLEAQKIREKAEALEYDKQLQLKANELNLNLEREMANETNKQWSNAHVLAKEAQDLQEFAQNNTTLVIDDDVKELPITSVTMQLTQRFQSEHQVGAKMALDFQAELKAQFELGAKNSELNEEELETLANTRKEMIEKLQDQETLLDNFSSLQVHIQALNIFESTVLSMADNNINAFIELCNLFDQVKSTSELEDVQEEMKKISTNLLNKWTSILKNLSLEEKTKLFEKVNSNANTTYGCLIGQPIFEELIKFVNLNLLTSSVWSVVLAILKNAGSQSLPILSKTGIEYLTPIISKVLDKGVMLSSQEYDQISELLYRLITNNMDSANVHILISWISNLVSSIELQLKNKDKAEESSEILREEIVYNWILHSVDKFIEFGYIGEDLPLPQLLLDFLTNPGFPFVPKNCNNFIQYISTSLLKPTVDKLFENAASRISAVICQVAKMESPNVAWNFAPDFLLEILSDPPFKIDEETRSNLLNAALYCGKILQKLNIKTLESFFNFTQEEIKKEIESPFIVKYLELVQIIIGMHPLALRELLPTVGEIIRQLLVGSDKSMGYKIAKINLIYSFHKMTKETNFDQIDNQSDFICDIEIQADDLLNGGLIILQSVGHSATKRKFRGIWSLQKLLLPPLAQKKEAEAKAIISSLDTLLQNSLVTLGEEAPSVDKKTNEYLETIQDWLANRKIFPEEEMQWIQTLSRIPLTSCNIQVIFQLFGAILCKPSTQFGIESVQKLINSSWDLHLMTGEVIQLTCSLLVELSSEDNFQLVATKELALKLEECHQGAGSQVSQWIIDALCTFPSEITIDNEFLLKNCFNQLSLADSPRTIVQYFVTRILTSHNNNEAALVQSQDYINNFTTFLDYSRKFPETFSLPELTLIMHRLGKILSSERQEDEATRDDDLFEIANNFLYSLYGSTLARRVSPIDLHASFLSVGLKPGNLISGIALMCFKIRLYRRFWEHETNCWNKFTEIKLGDLEEDDGWKAPKRYLSWTQELESNRKESQSRKWSSEWVQWDPQGVMDFLADAISIVCDEPEVTFGIERLDILFLMDAQAERLLSQGGAEEALELYSQITKLSLQENDSECQKLIEKSYMARAKILMSIGEDEKALELLNQISEPNEEIHQLKSQIQTLNSLLTLDFQDRNLPPELKIFYDFLTSKLDLDKAQYHFKQFCTKYGLDILASSSGRQIIQLIINLGDDYDLNVIEDFGPSRWGSELLRSYLLSNVKPFLNKIPAKKKEELGDICKMFDSLLIYHKSIPCDNIPFLEKLHKSFPMVETSSVLEIKINLLAFHTQLNPEDDIGTCRKKWLESRSSNPVTDEESLEFWELLSTSGWMNATTQNLLIVESLMSKLGPGTPLSQLVSILRYSTPEAVKKMLNPFFGLETSVQTFAEEVQLRFIHGKIDEMFEEFSNSGGDLAKDIRFNGMRDNSRQLCQRMLPGDEGGAIKSILELAEKKMAHSEGKSRTKELVTFVKSVNMLYSYRAAYNFKSLPEELHQKEIEDWPEFLAELAVTSFMAGDNMPKTQDELVEELKILCQEEGQDLDVGHLVQLMKDVPDYSHLTKVQIQEWVKSNKGKNPPLVETVGILKQSIFHFKGYNPRETQLLSFLILLTTPCNKSGRLAKIATGEGKSIIVAMLAAYWALQDKYVDIVTSSTILAQRDAEEFAPFFSTLFLTVGDISGNQEAKGKPKSCYSKNILYGDSSMYQGDILRHEFSLLNTRGGRSFDVVIVDEVDSMLIDQGGHSTRLVDKMPAMEHLQQVFLAIWMHLQGTMGRLMPIEDQMYFMEEVPGADESDWMDLIAKSKTGQEYSKGIGGNQLSSDLNSFCAANLSSDLKNELVRAGFKILIEAGVLSVQGDSTDDEETSIDLVIKDRWSINSRTNQRMNLQRLLNTKISIYSLDIDRGFVLSPFFHLEESNIEDEFEEEDYSGACLKILNVEGKFFILEPVHNENSFIKEKVRESVLPMFIRGDSHTMDSDKLKIPPHLWELYLTKLNKWIDSAITAHAHVVQNRDYLVKYDECSKSNKVIPIDFESTGILQEGTVWSDGIHQFLQIKHKLPISPEHLATNFLSNLAFFRRYSGRIYGLTGTLGSLPEKDLLSRTYNVDTVSVPQFKTKQHLYMETIVTPSMDNWLSAIATSVLVQMGQKRSILIICKSIKAVDEIEAYLSANVKGVGAIEKELKRYTRSDQNAEVEAVGEEMSSGTVIIATNLAGRGTDIKLSKEVVAAGGLHVCITFLPTNLRVEQQATGRASRGGQPGTSQLIINAESDAMFPNLVDFLSPQEIKTERDTFESSRVGKIASVVIPQLEVDEFNFKEFCQLRSTIHGLNDPQTLAAVDERWGIALDIAKTNANEYKNHPVKKDQFSNLFTSILSESSNTVIKNNYYNIHKGIDYNAESKYDEAKSQFDNAISLDRLNSANAFYYKAYAIVNEFGEDYKENASKALVEAADLIQGVHIPSLLACHQMAPSESGKPKRNLIQGEPGKEEVNTQSQSDDSALTQQILNKISLFKIQIKSIEESLKTIEKEKEVVAEMVGVHNYFEELKMPPPDAEIDLARETGLCGFIKIKKKPPPCWAIFTVILVGVVQAVVGAVLAVCTGGAFGTGLISDGVADVSMGIQAAINGEYISLADFFKEKAICIAISALAAAAGAALSAAAKTVSTFVKGIASKFMKTGLGKLASRAFQATKKFLVKGYNTVKDALKNGYSGFKTGLSSNWSKFSKFISKVSPHWLKSAGSYAQKRLTSAWNWIKDTWKSVKDWTKRKVDDLMQKLTPKSMTQMQKNKLTDAGKLIGHEAIQTTLVQGLSSALDKSVMEPLKEAIQEKLEQNVKDQVSDLLNNDENSEAIRKYFSSAGNESEFEMLWRHFEKFGRTAVTEQLSSSKPSEAVGYVFKALKEFSGETKRIMGDEKNKLGHRNVIATVVSYTTKACIESAKFGILVEGLRKFVTNTWTIFYDSLEKNKKAEVGQPFISTGKGSQALQVAKGNFAANLSKQISECMVNLIEAGIFKPPISMSLKALATKMNPIKQKDVLEDLKRIHENSGHPERNPNASLSDILGGKPRPKDYNRQNAGQFDDNGDKRELRRQGAGEFDNFFNKKPSNNYRRQDAGEFGSNYEKVKYYDEDEGSDSDGYEKLEEIRDIAMASGQRVEVYKINDGSGEFELQTLLGTSGSDPIRVLETGNGYLSRYDPIVQVQEDPSGPSSFQVIPLKELDPSYGGVGRTLSLFQSTLVSQSSRGDTDQFTNAFLRSRSEPFDIRYNRRGTKRLDNILPLASFNVRDEQNHSL